MGKNKTGLQLSWRRDPPKLPGLASSPSEFSFFCREIAVMIRKDCFRGFLASQSRFVYHSGVGVELGVIVSGGENWERGTFCLLEFIYSGNIKSVSFLNKVSLLANRMK